MKTRYTLLVALAIQSFSMTSLVNADEAADLAKATAQVLALAASEKDSTFQYKEGKVISGRQEIRVRTVLQKSQPVPGRAEWVFGTIRFDVFVGGVERPEMMCTKIGVGKSVAAATGKATEDWYADFGKGLFAAIGGQPTDMRLKNFSVYLSGPPQIHYGRAEGDRDLPAKLNQQIIRALKSGLSSNGDAVSVVEVSISVHYSDGSVDIECLVNGEKSSAAMSALQEIRWPTNKGNSQFINEVYFFARKAKGK